ncbi:uncharacterized protein IWZ02DRAFT_308061 [Phyllosticta citriasiana]|uniref:uncharacterized protein n=1 Tax=Phyllosticta citriasiana TaxID=595635 RepID=UPI0030FDE6C7
MKFLSPYHCQRGIVSRIVISLPCFVFHLPLSTFASLPRTRKDAIDVGGMAVPRNRHVRLFWGRFRRLTSSCFCIQCALIGRRDDARNRKRQLFQL